ncbi:hypothetical protein JTE90_029607 [Oedothorax gibbosus]|uniref:Uncharacterized protein n=1 Tax=Oedothorax gibbosus TaxID=931172 RepID=A0AAV6UUY0_9ARAC|nr:hypothetical protein JTE90_029607 [Oedothorax gibbosus]
MSSANTTLGNEQKKTAKSRGGRTCVSAAPARNGMEEDWNGLPVKSRQGMVGSRQDGANCFVEISPIRTNDPAKLRKRSNKKPHLNQSLSLCFLRGQRKNHKPGFLQFRPKETGITPEKNRIDVPDVDTCREG